MNKGIRVFESVTIIRAAALTVSLMLVPSNLPVSAQVFSAPKGQVENVSFEQLNGGVFNIYYDLRSDAPDATFRVSIQVSDDGGKTFTLTPAAITGDVENVRPGRRKKIVWQSGQDIGAPLSISQLKFNVVAVGGDTTPQGGKPTAAAGNTTTATKSNPLKWIIPVVGGAGAVAAIAVSKGGSSGGAGTTPPPTPCSITLGNITEALPTDKGVGLQGVTIFQFTTSQPTTTGTCTGAISVKWDFGDGTTASGVDTGAHVYQSSATFTVKLTASDGGTASAGPTTQSLTVAPMTGTWTGTINTSPTLTFTMQLVQSGTTVNGSYVDKNGPGTVTAPGLGDPKNVSLRVGQGNRTIDVSCKGDVNMNVCSGNVNNAYTATMTMTRQ